METNFLTLMQLGCEVEPQARLSQYTTFRLGGPCRYLIKCSQPNQLEETIRVLKESRQEFLVIGQGANVLVSDEGVDAAVIRYYSQTPIIRQEENALHVSASTLVDDVAEYAAQRGLAGLNKFSGIPGTIGGAIVGNAGAFGAQISDAVQTVCVISPAGIKKTLTPSELEFSYRHSVFKESGDVILNVGLSLKPGAREDLLIEREEILRIRKEKHPDYAEMPSAGSFFRNIEPTSEAQKRQACGWFLEQAGAKNLKCGCASVYEKHANIIVCEKSQCAQDVYDLAQKMADSVKKSFGITLAREVRYVGKFRGMPEGIKDLVW